MRTPSISIPTRTTDKPDATCNTEISRKRTSTKPTAAAIIVNIVAVKPAREAATIRSLILPLSIEAVMNAAGPAMIVSAISKTFSNLNKPEAEITGIVPLRAAKLINITNLPKLLEGLIQNKNTNNIINLIE